MFGLVINFILIFGFITRPIFGKKRFIYFTILLDLLFVN